MNPIRPIDRLPAILQCALPLFAGLVRATDGESRTPPNIVIFLADDMGYGDLGCHGEPHIRTPNIDQFASESVEFTSFHVNPVCAPTRAALMTGRYPFRTGVCDVYGPAAEMDPTEITMAERLHELSYATGIFGKWHLDIGAEQSPKKKGLDEALTCKAHAMRQYFDPVLLHNGEEKRIEGYWIDIFTDTAIRFIREKRDQPFFVCLPANLIHVPLQVPDELKAPFDGLSVSEATRKIYGMSSSLDSSFGRVRAVLQELGWGTTRGDCSRDDKAIRPVVHRRHQPLVDRSGDLRINLH